MFIFLFKGCFVYLQSHKRIFLLLVLVWHEHKPNFLFVRLRLLSHWKKTIIIVKINICTRQILISHTREFYFFFIICMFFFTYLEPLEDLDLHTGLETRPVVSWAPREVLRISIRIIRKNAIKIGIINYWMLAFFCLGHTYTYL